MLELECWANNGSIKFHLRTTFFIPDIAMSNEEVSREEHMGEGRVMNIDGQGDSHIFHICAYVANTLDADHAGGSSLLGTISYPSNMDLPSLDQRLLNPWK